MEETRLRINPEVCRLIDEFRGVRTLEDRLRAAQDAEEDRLLYARMCHVVEAGPLTLPAHEPCGFERARGALIPLQARVDACPAITCFVVGHAPDCECALL